VSLRIGVDIGGNDIKFGATNLDGDQVLLPDLVKRPSLAKDGPQQTIVQVLNGVQAVLAQLSAGWADVADIAVTVPCPCTPEGLIIEATNLGTPETKRAWQVPFGEYLAAAGRQASGMEIPVFACNDANAAGQDDDFVRYGLDASRRTSVFITTGTGLGGCIMINGSVHFGVGQAGELGHVKPALPAQYLDRFAADPNPLCGCGGYQCIEARAALKGLIRRVTWAVTDAGVAHIEKDLASRGERLNGQVLASLRALHAESPQRAAYEVRTFADRDQDALSRWLLEDWAIMIGVLFANLAPVVHPDLFIIGGGMTEMSDAGREWFISVVRRVYSEVNAQACFKPEASKEPGSTGCEIVWSVSRDQGWRGAILMGMRARPAGA